jgi:hypothetical protein
VPFEKRDAFWYEMYPPAAQKDFEFFEEKFQFAFPIFFRQLFEISNGGTTDFVYAQNQDGTFTNLFPEKSLWEIKDFLPLDAYLTENLYDKKSFPIENIDQFKKGAILYSIKNKQATILSHNSKKDCIELVLLKWKSNTIHLSNFGDTAAESFTLYKEVSDWKVKQWDFENTYEGSKGGSFRP